MVSADCESGICFDVSLGRRVCGDCRIDADCELSALGPRCVNNLCQDCAANFDCPAERPFCVAIDRCFNNEPCACRECRQETDCPQGEFCDEQGTCEGTQCASNNDCLSGRVCQQGSCVFPSCTTNIDCPFGFACVTDICSGNCKTPDQGCGDCAAECCSGIGCGAGTCCDFGESCSGPGGSCG